MKYYVIAGEASGDLHGSNLIKEIKKIQPESQFRAWGGDKMKKEGANVVVDYKDIAFMGFKEVITNLPTIVKNIKFCKNDILNYNPDLLILIDYPGFNLRIASFAKKNNIKVIFYISPQIWAWKENRIKIIKKYVDRMIVILPFEKDFYAKHNYQADYVGHPLLDEIYKFEKDNNFLGKNKITKEIIAILPGSRKQEISRMLPIMLKIISLYKNYEFVIAGAPGIQKEYYQQYITDKNTKIVYNETYNLFSYAKAALVTSGTATLETALFRVPLIICYKGNGISFFIAKRLVKVKYISLVNLIMDKLVSKELIQNDFNETMLKNELDKILNNKNYQEKMLKDYDILWDKLGNKGASEKAAKIIIRYTTNSKICTSKA